MPDPPGSEKLALAARRAPASLAALRPWYGPRILLVAFVSYLISTGFIFSIFGVFIRPVGETFGASMATMGLLPVLYHLISSTLSPPLGRYFARARIRSFMLGGACLLPLGLLAVSRAGTIVQAALCFGSLAVVGSIMMGPLASNTLVTHWYGPSRGRALGIASAGATGAGIVLPPLAALLIGTHGWRDALALLALLGAALSFPVFLLLAVDRPEDVGQRPEAGASNPSAESAKHEGPPISTREMLRTPQFWAIAALFGLLFAGGLISITFLVPYAEQLGLSTQQGAWILALRSGAAILGQITLGWLSDQIGRRPVLWLAIVTEFVFWLVIVRAPSVWAFGLAGIGVGFVGGSFVALRGSLVASIFGRPSFSAVSGMMVPAALPFQVMAVPYAGHLFDRTGDYAVAFQSFLFVFPVAALLLLCVPDRPVAPVREG